VGDSHLNKLAAHVVPEILFGVTRGACLWPSDQGA